MSILIDIRAAVDMVRVSVDSQMHVPDHPRCGGTVILGNVGGGTAAAVDSADAA